ncbi:AbiH family protein [Mycoplasma marinum]|uniref:Uncharacterized protein n=1 Tax=Mycoplasma marinum TaxID=1937190 RepID=A0A4R0XK11_9MOLU|nr:AbiH family protein [Mycoplasma marinum]TCG10973.1 hypothetical protein C4B24_03360 [Mycoplasma marinum]
MKKQIKRIIIIGNGMDIDHGLRTNWREIFDENSRAALSGISSKMNFLFSKNRVNNWWNDFEKELGFSVAIWRSAFTEEQTLPAEVHQLISRRGVPEERGLVKNMFLNLFNKFKDKWNTTTDKEKDRYCEEHSINDLTIEIKKILIRKIKEQITEANTKLKIKAKYINLFEKKNYFVVNYNYTEFYSKQLKYYDKNEAVHIHGIIDESTPNNFKMIADGFIPKNVEQIKLGLYQLPISSLNIEKKLSVVNLEETKENRKILNYFLDKIGFNNLFFNKSTGGTIDVGKDFSKVDEALVIGHSLSGNDLPYLREKIPNIDLNKIKKVIYYSYFDNSNAFDQEKEISKITKIFPNVEKIKIHNNNEYSTWKTTNIDINQFNS